MNVDCSSVVSSIPEAVDLLARWEKEVPGAKVTLTLLRIDGNDQCFIPFMVTGVPAHVHYVDDPAVRAYVHCNGADCLLCRIGNRSDKRDLLPVYDVASGTVAVLPITPALRPYCLRPQLVPVLRQVKEGGKLLVCVSKDEKQNFHVCSSPLPSDADDGTAAIARFMGQFEAKQIDLASVYQRLSNDVLAEVPKIKAVMQVKGVKA